MKNARIRRRVSAVALNALLAVLAVLWLVPVFWLIVSSFRAEQGAYTQNQFFFVYGFYEIIVGSA